MATLPMPSSMPSASNVRKQAEALAIGIKENFDTLHSIVLRSEGIIQKRWLKRTKNKRVAILLKSWTPGMPARHRPDFWALSHPNTRRQNEEKWLNCFKFPYLNLEDLSSKNFLIMLNSRARNPPHIFARSDVHSMHLLQTGVGYMPAFLNFYTMYLSEEHYGKLVSWDDDDKAFNLMWDSLQFNPGEGLWAMEAEDRVLKFLIDCCREIMIDTKLEDLTTNWDIQPEPEPITTQDPAFTDLSILKAEATYQRPSYIDVSGLLKVVAARKLAAEDHIWGLREDPAYFASTLKDLSEYHLGRTSGSKRKAEVTDDEAMWQRIAFSLPPNSHAACLLWDEIHDLLSTISHNMRPNFDTNKSLPKKLEEAFLELRFSLGKRIDAATLQLQRLSPKYDLKSGVVNGSLMDLLTKLFDGKSRFLYGLPKLVDEIQRIFDADKSQKDTITAFWEENFSDLAIMAQIWHECETFFPWSAAFETTEVNFTPKKGSRYHNDTVYLDQILKTGPQLGRHVLPLSKFTYPAEKAVTQSNITRMVAAEKALDGYWEEVDRYYQEFGEGLQDLLRRHGYLPKTIRRTPEWSPIPDKQERPAIRDADEPSHARALTSDIDTLPGRFAPMEIKEKVKTRGVNTTVADPSADETAPAKRAEEGKIHASARALKVFNNIFPAPKSMNQRGEVSWHDFVQAMTDIGCTVLRLQGSAWQFVPRDSQFGIQFHQPHTNLSKLPPAWARRIARRLERTYGWTIDSFEMEDKS